MQNVLPWILVALVALVALLVLVLALLLRERRRREASARRALDEAAADAERRHIVDASERTRSLSVAEEHRVRTVAELTAVHAAELADAEERTRIAREDERAARDLLSATWGHEAASHAHIVAAFASARLSGILATNVVFSRTGDDGARFVQQIDHVVVTSRTVLIIENKRWRGIVFDGVVPSSEHARLRSSWTSPHWDGPSPCRSHVYRAARHRRSGSSARTSAGNRRPPRCAGRLSACASCSRSGWASASGVRQLSSTRMMAPRSSCAPRTGPRVAP
ncbi:nuclease-related domain-containing protein [Clavibacter nebraskensis]|uniref:nuclease-related domain-containing protein n=1 Tax=Clavibacter nebraskensis TaxID=31963 RepID=UPI0012FA55B7|nr:nuclease-related domain-containing protein [Clavibacter nebraskensis]QGV66648.2 NERD domain-containing protein [Clavibacter nebraskensis]